MSLITPRHVVDRALHHVGAPYLWTGKGMVRWTPEGLKPNGYGLPAFDCSGLVTCALVEAGGPDWRATHNAAAMFAALDAAPTGWELGALRFYGPAHRPTHVALSLGNELVLEAGGGDSSTVSLEIARRANARVRVCFERRRDFVGARLLPLTAPAARS